MKNNSDETLEGTVRAYYAPHNMLYQPYKWTQMTTETGEYEIAVVGYDADTGGASPVGVLAGAIGLGERAYRLSAVENPNEHHCMMAIASNPDGSFIDLPKNFKNDTGLWEFLRNNPQIAYNNIIIDEPTAHTYEFSVDYGNYDQDARKFVLNIELQDGIDTMVGAEINVQSTNVRAPFSATHIIEAGKSDYCIEYTVAGNFFDALEFAVVMPNYKDVKARMHVTNYAMNLQENEEMLPDAALSFCVEGRNALSDDKYADTATMLGDFYLCLGEGMEDITPSPSTSRSTQALRQLEITQAY